MVAIVHNDEAYGRNVPGTILFSTLFIVNLVQPRPIADLEQTFVFTVLFNTSFMRHREKLLFISSLVPAALTIVACSIMLHQPLRTAPKRLVLALSSLATVGFSLLCWLDGGGGMWLFFVAPVTTFMVAAMEQTYFGGLFLPFVRTNTEIIIV